MNRKKVPFFSAGLSSILLVFVMLCLISLPVMALSATKTDYQYSKRLADRCIFYYSAGAKTNDRIQIMDEVLCEAAEAAADRDPSERKEAFLSEAGKRLEETLSPEELYTEGDVIYCRMTTEVSDFEQLAACFEISWSEEAGRGIWNVTGWKTEQTQKWEAEDKLPVLKKE